MRDVGDLPFLCLLVCQARSQQANESRVGWDVAGVLSERALPVAGNADVIGREVSGNFLMGMEASKL